MHPRLQRRNLVQRACWKSSLNSNHLSRISRCISTETHARSTWNTTSLRARESMARSLSLHSVQMFHVDHRSQSSPPSTQTFQAERLVLWTSDSMTQAEWTRKKRRKTKKERTDPTPDPAGAVTVATRGNVPRGTFSPSERMRRGRSSWALFVIHLKPNWATREGSTWNVRVLVGRRNDQGDRDLDVFHVEHHRWVCLSTSGKLSLGCNRIPLFPYGVLESTILPRLLAHFARGSSHFLLS
jgi:hypothetical protein